MSSLDLKSFITEKTIEHLELTFFSVVVAILVAVPIGIFLAKCKKPKLGAFVLHLISITQKIPALALMGLIIALLMLIKNVANDSMMGIFSGIVVLVVYAILPILSNTFSGIKQISQQQIEVAKKLKMTKLQIFSVEIKLALPFLFKGIRIATVLTVSMATLVSLVGSGGLGGLIIQGLNSMQISLILAGALPAAFLAISLDWLIAAIAKWVLSISKINFM